MPPAAANNKRGKKPRADDPVVASLDLEVPVTSDLDIAHDKRKPRKVPSKVLARAGVTKAQDAEEDRVRSRLGVLPADAHHDEGEDEDDFETFDDMQAQAALAEGATSRQRRDVDDEDFGLDGLAMPEEGDDDKRPTKKKTASSKQNQLTDHDTTLVAVERDYKALTSDERIAMLKKESPEVLALVQDLGAKIAAANDAMSALKMAKAVVIKAKGASRENELVDFLEAKTALMLMYCAHVSFYLLLKVEGRQIDGHPVVDRLVEIRTYLEKLRPVEGRLSYSLQRLLSGGQTATSTANVGQLRSVDDVGASSGLFAVNKSRAVDDERAQRRKAAARVAQQQALEAEEEQNLSRTMTKKIAKEGDYELLQAAVPNADNEESNHLLTGLVEGSGSDDEDGSDEDADSDDAGVAGKSLISKLRERVSAASKVKLAGTKKPKAGERRSRDAAGEDGDEGEAYDDGDDDGEDVDYEALLAEQHEAEAAKAMAKAHRPEHGSEREVARRNASQGMLNHRGLTKSRPKDKKNPRVNRREKARKGEVSAKAQNRSTRVERADEFAGVTNLKPHITHTTKFA